MTPSPLFGHTKVCLNCRTPLGRYRHKYCKHCAEHVYRMNSRARDSRRWPIVSKYCSGCRTIKSITEFYFRKTIRSYSRLCKECVGVKVRRQPSERACPRCGTLFIRGGRQIYCSHECGWKYRYGQQQEQRPKHPITCSVCGGEFYSQKNYKTCSAACKLEYRRVYHCKKQQAKRNADPEERRKSRERLEQWRLAHPDKVKEMMKATKRRRDHKVLNLPHTLSATEWQRALEYFEFACAYCGVVADAFHQEHFIPLSRGGGYTADNILPACPTCNSDKLATMPLNWLVMQESGLVKYVQLSQYLEGR